MFYILVNEPEVRAALNHLVVFSDIALLGNIFNYCNHNYSGEF